MRVGRHKRRLILARDREALELVYEPEQGTGVTVASDDLLLVGDRHLVPGVEQHADASGDEEGAPRSSSCAPDR